MEIIVDSVRGRLQNCPGDIAKELYKKLSYLARDYQYSTAYLDGRWDGYVRKFSLVTYSFPSGLLNRVKKFLEKKKIAHSIIDRRRRFGIREKAVLENIDEFELILRPYQIKGLVKGIKNPYMIFWWATASGKTVMFAALCSAFKKRKRFRKTLILVSFTDLASQHREELGEMLGEEIGVIEEGRFLPKNITVAVINTLWIKAVKKKDKEVLRYLNDVEYLVADECHRIIDSKMMKSTINKCKNTIARHGFSGSPWSLTTDDIELECVTGPPLSKVTMSQLIREGWISRPHIILVKYDENYIHGVSYQTAYTRKIVNGKARNSAAIHFAYQEYLEEDNSILILVRIIKHGKILLDGLLAKGVDPGEIEYIHGSVSKYKRETAKSRFKMKELRILIASQIWNEGINVPTVDVLVKADGGGGKEVRDEKGVRTVVQQIGRVARKPAGEDGEVDTTKENIVRVYDFVDNVHKDLWKHFRNRKNTYSMEEEYVISETEFKKPKEPKGKRTW